MFKTIFDYITYFIASYVYRLKVLWLGADVTSLTISNARQYTDIPDFNWKVSNSSEENFNSMKNGAITLQSRFNQYDVQIMARCKAAGDGNRYIKITVLDANDGELSTRSTTMSINNGKYGAFNLTHRFTGDQGYKIKIQCYGETGDVFDFMQVNLSATRNTVAMF